MKKIMFILFAFMLCVGLALFCSAEEVQEASSDGDEEWNVKEYVQEKIVPVAVGVITSVLALLATIGTVSRSLKSLSELKEGFGSEAKKRQEQFQKEAELFKACLPNTRSRRLWTVVLFLKTMSTKNGNEITA